MPKLLAIAHTPSSNTQTLAAKLREGLNAGADDADAEVHLLSPFNVDADWVQQASGIVLFTTENFGYMSGALKDFFERVYYPCLEHTQGLPYCLIVRAGHDGTGTVNSVERIAKGLSWRQAQSPLLCRGPFQEAFADQCHDYAQGFAAGIAMGIF